MRLTVQVEVSRDFAQQPRESWDRLLSRVEKDMLATLAINPGIELKEPGTLPRYEGKAVRVTDVTRK
jgi:phenylacetate-CoA ligase